VISNKELYKTICETEGLPIPLFLQYWWMEAVCAGKQWDVAMVFGTPQGKKFSLERQEGDTLVAALPYLIGKRMGMRFIIQPQLTQYNGVWYNYQFLTDTLKLRCACQPDRFTSCQYSESERLDFEKRAAEPLLSHLDQLKLSFYQQNFSPEVTNWLPFHWGGYSETLRYTYRIENLSNLDAVFNCFDVHHRASKIRSAVKVLSTDYSLTPEAFAKFHKDYWNARGKGDILSSQLIERVCRTAIDRNQGAIVSVRNESGELMGARFVVWDNNCSYSLLSALNLGKTPNGTSPLLFWEALKLAASKSDNMAFDFEGSMDEQIEQSYRLYGATQKPYHQVFKSNSILFSHLMTLKLMKDKRALRKRKS